MRKEQFKRWLEQLKPNSFREHVYEATKIFEFKGDLDLIYERDRFAELYSSFAHSKKDGIEPTTDIPHNHKSPFKHANAKRLALEYYEKFYNEHPRTEQDDLDPPHVEKHTTKESETIERMIENAEAAIQQSESLATVTLKEKNTDMSREEMRAYLSELLAVREGKCALSNISFLLDGEDGPSELKASLDRIDSSLGYIRGNLQVVCRFINIWKRDMNNNEFLKLLNLIHRTEPNQSW